MLPATELVLLIALILMLFWLRLATLWVPWVFSVAPLKMLWCSNLILGSYQDVNYTIILMSCIYNPLLKASKALCIENHHSFAPHSSLAVMIYMCSHRCPGADWKKRCCQSAPNHSLAFIRFVLPKDMTTETKTLQLLDDLLLLLSSGRPIYV